MHCMCLTVKSDVLRNESEYNRGEELYT